MKILNLIKNNEICSSHKLMPHSDQTIITSPTLLIDFLNLKLILVDTAIISINKFFKYDSLSALDAHVGDTLCQIRGAMLIYLSINREDFITPINYDKQTFIFLSKKIKNCISKFQNNFSRFKPIKFVDFLEMNGINSKISELSVFLTYLSLLSDFKKLTPGKNFYIDYEEIKQKWFLSKSLSRKLVHHMQIYLAEKSSKFMLSLAEHYFCKYKNNLLDSLLLTDEENRKVLPSYLVIDLLYQLITALNTPIFCIINRKFNHKERVYYVIFKYDVSLRKYIVCNSEILEESSYLVLKGDSIFENEARNKDDFLEKFESLGLRNIIFYNMAIHPQYSGKRLFAEKDDPYLIRINNVTKENREKNSFYQQFLLDKKKAIINGCAKEISHGFFIRHIYCASFNELYKLMKINYNQFEEA